LRSVEEVKTEIVKFLI